MRKAFSLIEIMVAISLFAILSISITMIAAGILRGAARTQVQIKVRNEAQYAMSVISQATRFAADVDTAACQPNSSTLKMKPKLGSNVVKQFICDGSTIVQDNTTLPLISDKVTITSCSFSCNDTFKTVTVHFEAKDADGLMVNPIIFDSQIILRNKF